MNQNFAENQKFLNSKFRAHLAWPFLSRALITVLCRINKSIDVQKQAVEINNSYENIKLSVSSNFILIYFTLCEALNIDFNLENTSGV